MFIGYPSGQKGYKVYDLDNHRTLISRDVTFHEKRFPYLLTPTKGNIAPLPCLPEEHDFSEIVDPMDYEHRRTPEALCNPQQVAASRQDSSSPSPTNSTSTNSLPILRHSTRARQPPIWMQDYIVHGTQPAHRNACPSQPSTVPSFAEHTSSFVQSTSSSRTSQSGFANSLSMQ